MVCPPGMIDGDAQAAEDAHQALAADHGHGGDLVGAGGGAAAGACACRARYSWYCSCMFSTMTLPMAPWVAP